MADTLQGPALAEALARLVGRSAYATRYAKNAMQIGAPLEFEPGAECEDGRVLVSVRPSADGGVWLQVHEALLPGVGGQRLAYGVGSGATLDEAMAAARDDALSRLRAGYAAVRDVLDPWREGPPESDGWYEVEASHPLRPYVVAWRDGKGSTLGGWAPGWAFAVGADGVERPARYRALHLSAPPERGTACTP